MEESNEPTRRMGALAGDRMTQVPILVISDCPSQNSGLARITRDLCTLLVGMPEFRVATLGKYGMGSSRLPWTQYQMQADEWGNVSLPMAWDEFSQDEPGIVMTIWDVTRLLWLARPEYADEGLREWLLDRRKRRFRLWGYVPIDATGPHNRLSAMSHECLLGFDRLAAYSPFGEEVIRNTIGNVEAEKRGLSWCPHGIGMKTFAPVAIDNKDTRVTSVRQRQGSAKAVELMDSQVASVAGGSNGHVPRIGIVATNQQRKEWGAVAAICAGLVERLKGEVKLWWHSDILIRHFSLPALIADFQLGEHVELTTPPMSDQEMASRLQECDLTLQVGSEGFGYGIFESLACGVPCLHGDYAGGASIMRTCGLDTLLVKPVQWRLEGQHNCLRPVYDPQDWVNTAMCLLNDGLGEKARAEVASSVSHLSWLKLGYVWKRWMREGLGK